MNYGVNIKYESIQDKNSYIKEVFVIYFILVSYTCILLEGQRTCIACYDTWNRVRGTCGQPDKRIDILGTILIFSRRWLMVEGFVVLEIINNLGVEERLPNKFVTKNVNKINVCGN